MYYGLAEDAFSIVISCFSRLWGLTVIGGATTRESNNRIVLPLVIDGADGTDGAT